jgi:hypothetical protein
MKKTLTVYLFISIFAFGFFSCKKNDTTASVQKTYLTKKTYRNIMENYYYDAQNRFSRMEYIDPSFTQTTSITAYDGNSNPTEYFIRTTGTTKVSKYNATYDPQNRPLTITNRDSINPTTFTLRSTYSFTYVGNKQIRSILNHLSGQTSVLEYTYSSEGNFLESKFTNASGVHTSSSTWSGYDNKNSADALLPHLFNGGMLQSKNNQTAESYTNVTTGVVTNYTAAHFYNSDNYVIQTTYSGTATPLVYNYTYEKR